jgi:hypothetical protein
LLDVSPFFTGRNDVKGRDSLPYGLLCLPKRMREAAVVFQKSRYLSEVLFTLRR